MAIKLRNLALRVSLDGLPAALMWRVGGSSSSVYQRCSYTGTGDPRGGFPLADEFDV